MKKKIDMKVLILKGLPASGKSTFAKQFVTEYSNWVRINRDDLRNMRGKYWLPEQENLITDWEQYLVLSSLKRGVNVILDSTNLNPKYLSELKLLILSSLHPVVIEEKFFDTSLEECILRDSKRENPVGEAVIRNFHNKYLKNDLV